MARGFGGIISITSPRRRIEPPTLRLPRRSSHPPGLPIATSLRAVIEVVACPSLLAPEVVAVLLMAAGIKIHGGFPVLANRHRGFMREIRLAASLAVAGQERAHQRAIAAAS